MPFFVPFIAGAVITGAAGGTACYVLCDDDETKVENKVKTDISSKSSVSVSSNLSSKASCDLSNHVHLKGCTMCAGASCHCRKIADMIPQGKAQPSDYTNCLKQMQETQSKPSKINFNLENKCTIDMASISNVSDNTLINQNVTQTVEQTAEALRQALQLPGGDTTVGNTAEVAMSVTSEIQKNFDQECSSVVKSNNKFECEASKLFADEIGVVLKNDNSIFMDCIQNIQSESQVSQHLENTIEQTASAKVNDNIASLAYVIYAIGFLCCIPLIYKLVSSSIGSNKVAAPTMKNGKGMKGGPSPKMSLIIKLILLLVFGGLWFVLSEYAYSEYVYSNFGRGIPQHAFHYKSQTTTDSSQPIEPQEMFGDFEGNQLYSGVIVFNENEGKIPEWTSTNFKTVVTDLLNNKQTFSVNDIVSLIKKLLNVSTFTEKDKADIKKYNVDISSLFIYRGNKIQKDHLLFVCNFVQYGNDSQKYKTSYTSKFTKDTVLEWMTNFSKQSSKVQTVLQSSHRELVYFQSGQLLLGDNLRATTELLSKSFPNNSCKDTNCKSSGDPLCCYKSTMNELRKLKCVNKCHEKSEYPAKKSIKELIPKYLNHVLPEKLFGLGGGGGLCPTKTVKKDGKNIKVLDKEYCHKYHKNDQTYRQKTEQCLGDNKCVPYHSAAKYATCEMNPPKSKDNKLDMPYTLSELNNYLDPITNEKYVPCDIKGDAKENYKYPKKKLKYETHYHKVFDPHNSENKNVAKYKQILKKNLNYQRYLQYLQIKYTWKHWTIKEKSTGEIIELGYVKESKKDPTSWFQWTFFFMLPLIIFAIIIIVNHFSTPGEEMSAEKSIHDVKNDFKGMIEKKIVAKADKLFNYLQKKDTGGFSTNTGQKIPMAKNLNPVKQNN